MSTRGLVALKADGVTKTSYNHSDSYPSWLGVRVVEQVETLFATYTVDELKQKVAKLRMVKESGKPSAADRTKYAKYAQSVSTGSDWYATLRSLQGDVIGMLDEGIMVDGSNSGDWQYCYLIDLDAMELVVTTSGDESVRFPFSDIPDMTRLTFE